jgi:transcriptional regulator with XRE-family HTH domain
VNLQALRAALHLSRERLARVLDVSARTVERAETSGTLPASSLARQRLAQLQEIAELGRLVYTAEGLERFLTIPMPASDHRTALDLVASGQADRVLAALAADYEGLGF